MSQKELTEAAANMIHIPLASFIQQVFRIQLSLEGSLDEGGWLEWVVIKIW